MSFRLFIYYCALCGAWAAFVAWGFVSLAGINRITALLFQAALIGGILGGLVAAAVGLIDAMLNAVGSQRFIRTAICGGLGFLAGAFGALVGQVLVDFIWSGLLVIGWMIAGSLIGATIGAWDVIQAVTSGGDKRASFKKVFNGILGGLIGGLIGGLPYTFLQGSQRLPNGSHTISLVSLGLCIGLLIGLAQVMLKEAWIKVEEGFRAGRELMLTKDETTIGRAESCDLGLFGDNTIAKEHAQIVLKNNRYMLAHVAFEGETYLNDEPVGSKPVALRSGDEIRVGRCVLRFGERQKRK